MSNRQRTSATSDTASGTVPAPSPRPARRWLGLAAVGLVLGHLLSVYLLDGGFRHLDWNSIAGRWAGGIGLIWDLAMVWVVTAYASVLSDGRRRLGRSGVVFQLVCTVLVVALAVLVTLAMVTTDLSLS